MIVFKKILYLFYPKKYKHIIWLIGSGRSGTTWISSMINYDNEFRELFEPFHTMFPELRKSGFIKHFYLDNGMSNKTFRFLASCILRGRFYHSRIEDGNSLGSLLNSNILLIKDIFANLMAYDLRSREKNIKPILLIRHPFAVALSKTEKKQWDWMHDPTDFFLQKELHDKFLLPFESIIKEVSKNGSYFEKQVLIWCVINYVPLVQFGEGELLVTFYEDWLSDPDEELKRVYSYVGLPFLSLGDINDNSKFKSPSKTSTQKVININSWKIILSQEEISSASRILESFGLDKLYDINSSPVHNIAEELLRRK